MVIAMDDDDSQHLLRLFNEEAGRDYLVRDAGVDASVVENLYLFGISGIANVLCAIKAAKYYELTSDDIVATVLTDSADMYGSRVIELAEAEGPYSRLNACADFNRRLLGARTDSLEELTYNARKRIHNLKYYTWVEQQGKKASDLDALWYDAEGTWGAVHRQAKDIDALIEDFNSRTGVNASI
jgi:hypothetical protein